MKDFEVLNIEDSKGNTKGDHLSPVTVQYQNIGFKVTNKDGDEVTLLKGVSGVCHPGRLLSIMGPSGAGKTTLLDILAGNVRVGKVEGQIMVNGLQRSHTSMRQICCYVMQNPILLSSATVRESLMTSALLRLPRKTPLEQKVKLVDHILEELGLTNCADVLIGNEAESIKGISGGEKRRLSVGIELVTRPSLILMDEPTSGLDSEIAMTIMAMLRTLAEKGRTVVCTIHQPNSDIVETFDYFALLAKGTSMYYGPWKDSVEFFSTAGFTCPTYKNPTDYFMSIAKNNENVESIAGVFKTIEARNTECAIAEDNGGPIGEQQLDATRVPAWYQTIILWKRFLLTWKRHPILFGAEFTQYAFIGVFIGLMYLQVSDDLNSGTFDRFAAQFFALAAIVFTPAFSAATLWDNERLLIKVETARNAYTLGPYFLAKTLTTWPMEIIFAAVFSALVYFMVGFQLEAQKFFIFWLVVVLFQLISESLGLLAAVSTAKAAYAVLLLSLVLLPLLSFTGFLVRAIPVYFKWIQKIAYINFATAALALTEFKGRDFKLPDGGRISGDALISDEPILNNPAAEQIRQTVSILDNGLTVTENIIVLAGMLFGMRILTYIALLLAAKLRIL